VKSTISANIYKTNNHFSPHTTEHKSKTMTYGIGNLDPDLGQAQKCNRVKSINVFATPLKIKDDKSRDFG
jgi:hypothetical protein